MNVINTKKLKDLVEFLDNKRKPLNNLERDKMRGEIPYYGANGVVDYVNDYLFDEPLILLAEDGGHFGSKTKPIAYKIEGKAWVNNHAHVLKPKNGYDIDYIKWSLSYYDVTKYATGSTRVKLTKGDAEKMELKIPDLKTQQKIAHVLENADKARQRRKVANALTDQFLQSSFLSVFGDPVKNDKGWEVKKLIDSVSMRGGGTPDTSNDEYYNGDIPWVSPKDMKYRFITTSIDKITEHAIAKSSTKLIEPENVLMVVRSGILKNTLPIGINIVPVAINQDMKALACKYFLNPYFLAFQLEATASHILQNVRGTTADNISSDVLKNINLIVPPLSLQQQFAGLVAQAEQLRKKQKDSEKELENLFQGLLQKYFG